MPTILACVSGSRALGMGHVSRTLRVVLELEQMHGYEGYFLGRWHDGADQPLWWWHPLHLQQFAGQHPIPHADIEWLADRCDARVVLFDLALQESELPLLERLRARGRRTVTLHEHTYPWAPTDLAISPTVVPQSSLPGRPSLQGSDYLLVDPRYAEAPSVERDPRRCVVVLGGADPDGSSARVTEELLAATALADFKVVTVRGPAGALLELPTNIRLDVLEPRRSLVTLFQQSRLAITNGGTTCYEALAAGCRVMALAQNPFEAAVIEILAAQGALLPWDPARLEELQSLPRNRAVDGLGVSRVARAIAELCSGSD